MPDIAGIPCDRDARPSLDEVFALRADRMGTVRRVVADLTDDQLDGSTEPVAGPGWPPPERAFPSGRSWPRSSTRSGGTGSSPSGISRP